MPLKLNRAAYQKLIDEDVVAMEGAKPIFVEQCVRLEWEHIIEVLKASPAREYGDASVAGSRLEGSLASFDRSCKVLISEEQAKAAPDTALVGVLCDAVRLSREYAEAMGRRDGEGLLVPGEGRRGHGADPPGD